MRFKLTFISRKTGRRVSIRCGRHMRRSLKRSMYRNGYVVCGQEPGK